MIIKSKNEIINIDSYDFEYFQYFIDIVRIKMNIFFVKIYNNNETNFIDFQNYRNIEMYQKLNKNRYFYRRKIYYYIDFDRKNEKNSQKKTKLNLIENHISLQKFRIRTNNIKSKNIYQYKNIEFERITLNELFNISKKIYRKSKKTNKINLYKILFFISQHLIQIIDFAIKYQKNFKISKKLYKLSMYHDFRDSIRCEISVVRFCCEIS